MARKKIEIKEDDYVNVIQRYSPTTILDLLQEVLRYCGPKIDWNALVTRSITGITDAREYRMVWRHLAYKHKLEAVAQHLDDDSDLECELEVVPSVSAEVSAEAAVAVKVLSSSGLPNDCGLPNRSAADTPVVNVPNSHTSASPSDEQPVAHPNGGANVTVPASTQKQPLQLVVLDGNATAASVQPPKKKRKVWTKQEDEELIAAVQKHGEGNWANISKAEFKHDRTASQLSQRWSTIRKRLGISCVGGGNVAASSTRTEQDLVATRKAVSMALNMPNLGSFTATCSGQPSTPSTAPASTSFAVPVTPSAAPAGTSSVVPAATSAAPSGTSAAPVTPSAVPAGTSSVAPATPSAAPAGTSSAALATPAASRMFTSVASLVPLQASSQATNQKGVPVSSNKSRITVKKLSNSAKPSVSPNSSIQAAAFAAGGRVASPSTAASLFKAAQSRTAVHIRHGASALSKPTVASTMLPPTSSAGGQLQSRQIRPTGTLPSSVGAKLGSHQMQESLGRCTTDIQAIAPTFKESKNEISNTKVDEMIEFDEMVARDRLASKSSGNGSRTANIAVKQSGVALPKEAINGTAVGSQQAETQSGVASKPASTASLQNEVVERTIGATQNATNDSSS